MSGPMVRSVEVTAPNSGAAAERGAKLLGVPRAAVEVRWMRVPGQDAAARLKKYRVTSRGLDGTFSFHVEGETLWLTVNPPERGGQAVPLAAVEAELARWPLAEVDASAVRGYVGLEKGEPAAVGRLPLAHVERSGPAAGLAVMVASDELSAYLVATGDAREAALTVDHLWAALAAAGVATGLDEAALAQFAAEQPRGRPALVARGGPGPRVAPVFGAGERPSGVAVEAGAPLLAVDFGEAGTPGVTVTGQPIGPGSPLWPDLERFAGPGTEVDPDGTGILAAVAGTASYDGRRVAVAQPTPAALPAEEQRGAPPSLVGRPVFGPGRRWVVLSAASAQVAAARGAELLGRTVAEVEVRQAAGSAPRSQPGEGGAARAPKRFRVQPRGLDGRFALEAEEDGLYLTVWPPQGGGRAATWAELQAELGHWPPLGLRPADIEPALRDARGAPFYAAAPVWLAMPCGHGLLGVAISDDEMTAHAVALGALRLGRLDEEAVLAALAGVGVAHGVMRSALALFCQAAERPRPAVVALALPPQEASNEPEYLFPCDEPCDDQVRPDVRPGDVVARSAHATAVPGRTVTGKSVAPADVPLRPLRAFLGEGAGVSPDGQAILATAAGRPTLVNGRVSVLPHERVAGTLEGEGVFAGSVTLAAVAPGARIRARGDIALESDSGDMVLEAGGSAWLHGVRGGGKARISAGQNVVASWLDACLVMARDTLHVGAQLVQSTVLAARRVLVEGDGLISGGMVRATDEIDAHTIRAGDAGSPTRIVVGKLSARGLVGRSTARVIVRGEVEPGVRISIDGATLDVTEPIQRSVLRQRGGAIQIEPLPE
ncbi:MAG: DUF342 domain-containing protein [Chloroflexi bacterium]|nr:DUF342 domain-containing protein [Chloroflexota bacterium]